MAIQANFPAIKPSLNLDFANTKRLDPRITFTRASTATYYDGVTTAKAEENLLIRSQEFDTASAWGSAAGGNLSAITANAAVAPDGTTTAEELIEDSTTSFHRVGQTSATAGVTTFSVFAKASVGTRYLTISSSNSTTNYASVTFDLSTGTSTQTLTNGTYSAVTTSSVNVGNSWYRCGMTLTVDTATLFAIGLSNASTFVNSNRGFPSYTGDSTSSIYVWGAQLEQRSSVTSYTPTTTQPITNYIPVLLTAANNAPRFDHNPTTDESLGLLIEEQRTNLLLQSEDLDTTWAETRATLNLNSVVSPAGTLTADRLIASTDDNTHFTTQTFTGTAASYTFTAYAKASGLNFIALRLFNGTSQVGLAYYNLSTGVTGTVTAGTATITPVGNGWYRCALTATLAASESCTADIYLASADNTNSFAGDAFDGVALWGFQTELGAFQTSYIPTVAATVTRSPDAASMTGTNFLSWFNNAEGTVYSESTVGQIGVGSVTVALSDGTANNRVQIQRTAGNNYQDLIVVGGVTQSSVAVSGVAANVVAKVASAYASNNFQMAANGTLGTQDTSGTVPVVDRLEFGQRASSVFLDGHIRRIAYYPLRLTNAQLQALTG